MLSKLKKSKTEGFTIIEVMIVLAIAGLILLIVFLAVPALQRNARNTQRKNDAAAYVSAISEDANNNNGNLTAGAVAGNAENSEASKAAQLTVINYNVSAASFQALPGTLVTTTAYVRNFSVCAAGGGGQVGVAGGSIRQTTVTYLVESPGAAAAAPSPAGNVAQCISSS